MRAGVAPPGAVLEGKADRGSALALARGGHFSNGHLGEGVSGTGAGGALGRRWDLRFSQSRQRNTALGIPKMHSIRVHRR